MMRARAIFAAAIVAALATRCSPREEGIAYKRVHIVATHGDGGPVPGPARDYCIVAPVLFGSRIEERVDIDPPLAIEVIATISQVELTFTGARPGTPGVVLRDAQLNSFSKTMSVEAENGHDYSVVISTGCPDAW